MYTAGAGETAIVSISVTGSPAQATSDVLYGFIAVWSGTTWSWPASDSAESADNVGAGTANVGALLALPLEPGKPYVFGASVASNSAMTFSPAYCHGVVQVVRAAA